MESAEVNLPMEKATIVYNPEITTPEKVIKLENNRESGQKGDDYFPRFVQANFLQFVT